MPNYLEPNLRLEEQTSKCVSYDKFTKISNETTDKHVRNPITVFIIFFSSIRVWYEFNTFFAFIKLSVPKIILSLYI